MESDDGFSREELDEDMAAGRHSKRIHDHCEAIAFVAFIIGMAIGAIIMDVVSG